MFQFRRFPLHTYVFSMQSPCFSRWGFPIRIPADLRLFAAPRSFSQLIASFFGFRCQGIHPVLFLAWTSWASQIFVWSFCVSFQHCHINISIVRHFCFIVVFFTLYIPVFCKYYSICFSPFVFYSVFKVHIDKITSWFDLCKLLRNLSHQTFHLLTRLAIWLWWTQVGSNHRPRAYQARALACWAMSPFPLERVICSFP